MRSYYNPIPRFPIRFSDTRKTREESQRTTSLSFPANGKRMVKSAQIIILYYRPRRRVVKLSQERKEKVGPADTPPEASIIRVEEREGEGGQVEKNLKQKI